MNPQLTEQIAYHVFANLGILPASFVNQEQTKSVADLQFLLPEKLTFQVEGGKDLQKNIYGCQIAITDTKDFKMLIADCTQEKDVPEYGVVLRLKDAPTFGVYLIFNKLVEDPPEAEALIAVCTDKKNWMPCTTYLQATFLAGMEQLRDLGFGWKKAAVYRDLYDQLLSFIKFHDLYFGGEDEGQED